nr:response regulator transcription factor [uncultured Enterobacter sp.]
MLSGSCKYAIVISNVPVIQSGLENIFARHFPEHELTHCRSLEELTLLQLRRAVLVIADLSGDLSQPKTACEQYYRLMSQYLDIHWVFMVPRMMYALSIELLMRPESTLLSDVEPIDGIISAIRAGSASAEKISRTLLSPRFNEFDDEMRKAVRLTLSERQVLRLIGKGWGINQIAVLLKKSNKTVSAQKNSAMRRLALRSNAEMYAWVNSAQGMSELNLTAAYGEHKEWKSVPLNDVILPSSKIAQ